MAARSSIVVGAKRETLITHGCFSAEKVSPLPTRVHFCLLPLFADGRFCIIFVILNVEKPRL